MKNTVTILFQKTLLAALLNIGIFMPVIVPLALGLALSWFQWFLSRQTRLSRTTKPECNNTRANWVRKEIYGQVWRDQPRGRSPWGFSPVVDPDTQRQVNSMLRVKECIVFTYCRNAAITQKLCKQSWISSLQSSWFSSLGMQIHHGWMIHDGFFIPWGVYGYLQTIWPSTVMSLREK